LYVKKGKEQKTTKGKKEKHAGCGIEGNASKHKEMNSQEGKRRQLNGQGKGDACEMAEGRRRGA
jgi:hypothetical protein